MLRTILVLFCYATGTVLSLRSVAYASSFFIWSEIFRPLDFARRFVFFKHAHLVAGVLLISLFLCKWKRRWNWVATMMCVLIGWMAISSTFAQFPHLAWFRFDKAVKYLIPLLIISISLVDRFGQNLFLYTLAASVGVWGAQAGLHCILTGSPNINMGIPGAQMTDRNDFIAGVIGALPLMAYAAWNYGWRYQRLVRNIAKATLVLSVAAIFFSLSRGGVLASFALFIYFMFATGRFSKRLVLGVVVLMVAVAFMPGFVTERLATIDLDLEEQSEASAAGRLNLIKVGINMTLAHPVTGVGPDNFNHMAVAHGHYKNNEPHNIWLKCSGEYGLPMLVMFILTILFLLKGLKRERRFARASGDRETEMMSMALSCAIVGFLAAQTFLSMFLSEFMWSLFGVAGAFLASMEAKRREEAKAARLETAPEPAPVLAAPDQAG